MADQAEERRAMERESRLRMKSAMKPPMPASPGGVGFERGMMLPEKPANRLGLPGKGFSAEEIRTLHDAAGPPRTPKTTYGPGEEKY